MWILELVREVFVIFYSLLLHAVDEVCILLFVDQVAVIFDSLLMNNYMEVCL